MDSKVRDARIMSIISDLKPQKETIVAVLGDEKGSQSESLLPPGNGGISKGSPKTSRKVHWKDTYGNILAEVLEFQPRDKTAYIRISPYPVKAGPTLGAMQATAMRRMQILVSVQSCRSYRFDSHESHYADSYRSYTNVLLSKSPGLIPRVHLF